MDLVRLSPEDNVAVAARRLAAGSEVVVEGKRYRVAEEIPLGHKMALVPIEAGQRVRKFGVPIGSATRPIAPGALVHVHNIRSDYLVNDVDHFEE